MKKDKVIGNAKNFDELLDIEYGKIGEKKRDAFEERAQYFVISETLKDARREKLAPSTPKQKDWNDKLF